MEPTTLHMQPTSAAPEWTWLWLGILAAAFLISAFAFTVVLAGRHTGGLGRLTNARFVRRSAEMLERRAPRLWKFLSVFSSRFVRPRLSTTDWRGLALTLAAVTVFVALYAFLLIAEGWTDEEALLAVDRRVYGWLVDAGGSRTVEFMQAVTRLGDSMVVTGLAIAIGIVLLIRSQYWRIAALVMATGAGSALVVGLKALYTRARPDAQVYEMAGHSFPSGHSFAAMALYGFVIYLVWRDVRSDVMRIVLATALSVLILLVGLSRILLRVHWVSDVAGGFTIGLAWLVLSLVIVRVVRDRYRPESAG